MPLANRTQRENDLAAALAGYLATLRRSIELGTPDFGAFLVDSQVSLREALSGVYQDAAAELFSEKAGEAGADAFTPPDATNTADQFAAAIAAMLANGMANNVRLGLAGAAANGRSIAPLFSPSRAATAAVTEITRAYNEGRRWAAGVLAIHLRTRVVRRWRTAEDDLVCEICGPLNGKTAGGVDGYSSPPPAHPNCRCEEEISLTNSPTPASP